MSSVPALSLPPCPAGCPEHAVLQPAPLSQPWLADPRHPPAPAAITMVTLGSTVLCQACLFLSKTQPAWLAFPGAGSAPQPSFSTQEQSSSPWAQAFPHPCRADTALLHLGLSLPLPAVPESHPFCPSLLPGVSAPRGQHSPRLRDVAIGSGLPSALRPSSCPGLITPAPGETISPLP